MGVRVHRNRRLLTSGRMGRSTDERALSFFAVDSPGNSEAVYDIAESLRPKGLLQRKGHRSAVGEPLEDALGRCHIVEIELNLKTLWTDVQPRQDVAAGKRCVTHCEGRVENFVLPVGGCLVGHRRLSPGKAERDSASEALLVERECRVTLAVEDQTDTRLDSHASIMPQPISASCKNGTSPLCRRLDRGSEQRLPDSQRDKGIETARAHSGHERSRAGYSEQQQRDTCENPTIRRTDSIEQRRQEPRQQ